MILKKPIHNKIGTNRESGFTITELLIYIGIFSILLVVLTDIFVTSLNTQLESEATSGVDQDSRFIIARLMYDIQKADGIDIPTTLGTQGNTLKLNVGGVSYTYALNGNDLELNVGGTVSKLNSSDTDISNLNFQRLGNMGGINSIKVGFTVTSKVQKSSGLEIKNVQTVIGSRNN